MIFGPLQLHKARSNSASSFSSHGNLFQQRSSINWLEFNDGNGSWLSSTKNGHQTSTQTQGVGMNGTSNTVEHRLNDNSWSQAEENTVLAPYDYLRQHPGKDLRSLLIHAFDGWLNIPKSSLDVIKEIIGMLHTASLLIDDVEDSSVMRRGIPVAHNVFGVAQSINSANYVYFLALSQVQKLNSPRAMEIYVEELMSLHRGQGMDVFWRDTLKCPSEDEYLKMVSNKTGGLFRLAVKLIQAESNCKKDCTRLANVLGVIFQICDDYLNLFNATYTQNKGFCEDLTEGKFSFPVIHAIHADPNDFQLINILKQKTESKELKMYAIDYMERMGSFRHTQEFISKLKTEAMALIDELDADCGTDAGGKLLKPIVDRIVNPTLVPNGS